MRVEQAVGVTEDDHPVFGAKPTDLLQRNALRILGIPKMEKFAAVIKHFGVYVLVVQHLDQMPQQAALVTGFVLFIHQKQVVGWLGAAAELQTRESSAGNGDIHRFGYVYLLALTFLAATQGIGEAELSSKIADQAVQRAEGDFVGRAIGGGS